MRGCQLYICKQVLCLDKILVFFSSLLLRKVLYYSRLMFQVDTTIKITDNLSNLNMSGISVPPTPYAPSLPPPPSTFSSPPPVPPTMFSPTSAPHPAMLGGLPTVPSSTLGAAFNLPSAGLPPTTSHLFTSRSTTDTVNSGLYPSMASMVTSGTYPFQLN